DHVGVSREPLPVMVLQDGPDTVTLCVGQVEETRETAHAGTLAKGGLGNEVPDFTVHVGRCDAGAGNPTEQKDGDERGHGSEVAEFHQSSSSAPNVIANASSAAC